MSSSSVVEKEIAFLDAQAEVWWNEEGIMKVLHTINIIKNKLMKEGLINNGVLNENNIDENVPFKGLKILDAGCGGGLSCEPLTKLGAEVTGIDPSEKMINVAKNHALLDKNLSLNLNYSVTTVEEHCIKNFEKYDVVISSEVLEHITNYESYLKACVKCLKPGGSLFITTFNKTWLAKICGIWLAEYVLNIVPRGMHDYDLFISPEDVEELLKKFNTNTVDVKGLMINPITLQWFLWFPTVQYHLHAVKQ